MPLSAPAARRDIHQRVVEMKAYAREDGLYDVEAHLIDTKPFPLTNDKTGVTRLAGQAIHDLWVRMTLDGGYVVQTIEAASDVTPYPLCKEAEATLQVLVGEAVASGWSMKVKQRLRKAAGCTHLTEMLVTMATTAYQGIRFWRRQERGNHSERAVEQLNTCYSYSSEREVIRMYWPDLYRSQPSAGPSS